MPTVVERTSTKCVENATSTCASPEAKYNKDQWISSFEDAILKLRPHMSARVLATVALMAWNAHGMKDVDPAKAAADRSKEMG
jgi:hypothetical protein